MKAYLVTVLVIDRDGMGGPDVGATIENVRYPNHCIRPRVVAIDEADIGEWHDGHPLNHGGWKAEVSKIFAGSGRG